MASKSKKNSKQQKEKPAPMQSNHTVRECLTWHYQKGYVDATPQQPQDDRNHHIQRKGQLGRPVSRGYEMDNSGDYVVHTQPEDGTVIEALRGWPHNKRAGSACDDQYNVLPPINTTNQDPSAEGKDPWMSDLISHRFLNDAVSKRQQQEEEDAKKEATARAKRSNKGLSEAKLNRTSQLRAIAQAPKVEVDPKDLWQLSRFKNKSRPHLTTVEKKQKTRKGSGNANAMRAQPRGSRANSATQRQGGDPCVCDDYNKVEDTYKYDDYLYGKNDDACNYNYNSDTYNYETQPTYGQTNQPEVYAV